MTLSAAGAAGAVFSDTAEVHLIDRLYGIVRSYSLYDPRPT